MTRPPHRVLPPDAIAKLQEAAKTKPTAKDPLAKTKAIEQATTWVRRKYPLLFQ